MALTDAPEPTSLLARPALAVELASLLKRMIVDGELAMGERVPEKALTERFGVSRTPLREALKVLAAEGFVDLVPNRGARVSQLSRTELEDGFPVLASLEGLAGELACARATDAEIAEIAALTHTMREHYDAEALEDYFRLNQAIHVAIMDAARSPTLAQTHSALAQRLRAARYAANISRERWTLAMNEHEDILAHLEARDAAKLGQALRQHIENKVAIARAG